MEVVKYLESTPPESVVLHPTNFDKPSLASNLAGRASVVSGFRSFNKEVTLGEKEFGDRIRDSLFFFEHLPAGHLILRKYNVDYVYAPMSYAYILDRKPELIRVIKNSGYVLYKVDRSKVP